MTDPTPTRDEAVQRIANLLDENADVYSENAMDRAFLGNSEELAGLVIDVLALTNPAPASIDVRKITPADVVMWAVDRWNEQVKNRPLVNIHRRSLDDAWRRVMRDFGGDPDGLVGPPHDELHAACVPSPKGNEHIDAPAPASGRADAVARTAILEALKQAASGGAAGLADYEITAIADELLASLSPAATPVSEAETVAWQTVSDFVDEMLRDWSGGDDCRMGFGVNGATVTKGQFRAVRSALASLSPAATPVSEAGGEAAERSWRRTKFEFIGAMRQALINSGLTREQVIIADNAITEAFSDLAKPASSPAGGGEP